MVHQERLRAPAQRRPAAAHAGGQRGFPRHHRRELGAPGPSRVGSLRRRAGRARQNAARGRGARRTPVPSTPAWSPRSRRSARRSRAIVIQLRSSTTRAIDDADHRLADATKTFNAARGEAIRAINEKLRGVAGASRFSGSRWAACRAGEHLLPAAPVGPDDASPALDPSVGAVCSPRDARSAAYPSPSARWLLGLLALAMCLFGARDGRRDRGRGTSAGGGHPARGGGARGRRRHARADVLPVCAPACAICIAQPTDPWPKPANPFLRLGFTVSVVGTKVEIVSRARGVTWPGRPSSRNACSPARYGGFTPRGGRRTRHRRSMRSSGSSTS